MNQNLRPRRKVWPYSFLFILTLLELISLSAKKFPFSFDSYLDLWGFQLVLRALISCHLGNVQINLIFLLACTNFVGKYI